jgi:hypothetical protein
MTRMRTFLSRRRGAVSLAAAALLVFACGTQSPSQPTTSDDPAPTTAAATTATVAPATSTASGPIFTADGIAPYTLGATLASLQAGGHVTQVQANTEVCVGNTSARGTGAYGDIRLAFRNDGKLYLVTNRSTSIPTALGARNGTTTYTELKSLYASTPHEELAQGGRKLYLAKADSGRGILFDIDDANKVFTMSAADSAYLHDAVVNGTDFC